MWEHRLKETWRRLLHSQLLFHCSLSLPEPSNLFTVRPTHSLLRFSLTYFPRKRPCNVRCKRSVYACSSRRRKQILCSPLGCSSLTLLQCAFCACSLSTVGDSSRVAGEHCYVRFGTHFTSAIVLICFGEGG